MNEGRKDLAQLAQHNLPKPFPRYLISTICKGQYIWKDAILDVGRLALTTLAQQNLTTSLSLTKNWAFGEYQQKGHKLLKSAFLGELNWGFQICKDEITCGEIIFIRPTNIAFMKVGVGVFFCTKKSDILYAEFVEVAKANKNVFLFFMSFYILIVFLIFF